MKPEDHAPQGDPDGAVPDTGKAPHLDESVRRIGKSGRDTARSALDTGRALRRLISADFALARSATGRAMAWVAIAVVFGASAWLLLMGALIVLLQRIDGISWLGSFSITALVSLVVTGVAGWRASVFFDYAGMHASRRQLQRLGLFSEDDEDDDQSSADKGTRPPMPSEAAGPQGDGLAGPKPAGMEAP
ncbi:phage holin family protein [Luteimonas yindakuii]|uniref:phage holin family protein n=1 Tax=Luteimonas yindakuii TaxID=2565782 RepID=UPI003CCD5F30